VLSAGPDLEGLVGAECRGPAAIEFAALTLPTSCESVRFRMYVLLIPLTYIYVHTW
jgi:hypothetical protein